MRAKRFAGHKFRRQTPIGRYIADFVCLRARLIVELDGGQHQSQREHDEVRDEWLRSQGFEVLRVWNSEWQAQPEAVLGASWEVLERRGQGVPLSHEGRGALMPVTRPSLGPPLPLRERGWGRGENLAKGAFMREMNWELVA
nr:DUF559 domain-containing protein [Vitreoscilla filiformis]